ncbi:MAG TPA: Gfo/Idh/MocA family oxidoreductase [Planctomycetaceae bacterium]|nr:Gfo/Idh/MocA family oxidoreductase [Planctomycetaceae bacterium]
MHASRVSWPDRNGPIHRRGFLEAAGAAASANILLGLAAESSAGFAANDTLNVACIGTGSRCRHLMKSLREIPDVRIAAVCDIFDVNLAEGAKLADPKAVQATNFHELLARRDIDAVLIGTPDHWHVPMTIAACEAGKDVYVEKPLTHNLQEGAAVIEAQNRHKRIVQVGTQQRSMPQFQKAYEIIQAGTIGKVRKVHLTWNRNAPRFRKGPQAVDPKQIDWKSFLGNAPEQPFDEYRFRHWRWFWDFGGGILTDLMVHYIDVVHWFMGVEHPLVATAIGDYFNSAGLWEAPDTIQCLLRYPNDFQVYFEGTFVNARNGAMLEFMGEDATLYLDRGRYEVHPERNKKVKPEELVLSKNPPYRGADFYDTPDGEMLHLANWIDCIRSRKTPNVPAEAGVSAASAAHLGNVAYRKNKIAAWEDVS